MSLFWKSLIVLIITIFLPIDICFAGEPEANCPTVDLSAKTGTIEEQGSTAWCYAYASSTLATFATGKQISAVDIAINYNTQVKDPASFIHQAVANDYKNENPGCFESTLATNVDDVDGGYSDLAFNETRKIGFCKLEDLPDEVKTSEGSYWSGKERIQEMEHALATINPGYACLETTFLHAALPTSDLRKLAEAIKTATATETVKAAHKFACHSRVRSRYVAEKVAFPRNDPQSSAFLQAELSAGRPAAVALNVTDLLSIDRKVSNRRLNESYRGSACFREERLDWAPHAIAVIGQRYNKERGRCEAMVKNSWGRKPSCIDYDTSQISCDNRGYVYVPFELIQKNVFHMTVLRPAKSK